MARIDRLLRGFSATIKRLAAYSIPLAAMFIAVISLPAALAETRAKPDWQPSITALNQNAGPDIVEDARKRRQPTSRVG